MSTKQPDYPASAQRVITVTMPYQRAYAVPLPRHKWQLILPVTGEVRVLTEDECEQSRKLRISVTKIENGPDRFF